MSFFLNAHYSLAKGMIEVRNVVYSKPVQTIKGCSINRLSIGLSLGDDDRIPNIMIIKVVTISTPKTG